MSNWIGQTIGGYQIAEEIGRGGVATVYRAYQHQLERWVAIKIMQATEASGQSFLARFRREAKAIAALRHPNILTIYDYGEEGGTAYFVMEYVAGGTLKDHLTAQLMEWPDAATLILPVGRALAYAHSEGIVHRDVKPANILLARPDWPLLADFGLVKLLDRQRGITQPGVSIGTPSYFSPEQAAGDEVDHRTDIYGLAIVLYELLTGRLPFEADSPIEMMLRRLREAPLSPRQLNSRITPQLEGMIMRALSRNPEARYPTMEALLHDLSRLPGATGRAVMPPSYATPPPTATTRLDAPGLAIGPRLVVMGTGAMISLPHKDEVTIGRGDPHVTPPDVDLGPYGGGQAGVSRCHARMLRRSEGFLLDDLNSTNGTFINSVPVTPGQPVRVRGGDVILCGQFSLVFYEA
ncbi:MAG: FHA domain-containing serine/threonine-protein kinase [Chloroflexota bacterium]|nr:FHA domain-containing serine/threonine-protein kinase [Chloroflexota bacterium]